MSLQVGHIYYARKFLAQANQPWDEAAFVVGTVFPDIRYLAKLEREVTHFDTVELKEVLTESDAFKAGFIFHSYLDILRDAYFQQQLGVKFGQEPAAVISKLIEDQWLHSGIHDWPKVIGYFDVAYPNETQITSVEFVRQWHNLWQRYFRSGPSTKSWDEVAKGIGYPADLLAAAIQCYPKVAQDPNVNDTIKDFETYFEEKLNGQ